MMTTRPRFLQWQRDRLEAAMAGLWLLISLPHSVKRSADVRAALIACVRIAPPYQLCVDRC